MKLLLDGDLFCFRSAAASENDGLEIAKARLDKLLDSVVERLHADSFQFFLSGPGNFRKTVYPEYKANRLNQPKPQYLEALRQYVMNELDGIMSDGCEADDLMGIAQSSQEGTIIVSLDKDMLQVPGLHYSWHIEGGTPEKRWVKEENYQEISPMAGQRAFWYQMLVGDPSDNIKGVPGIGKKKAENLLLGRKDNDSMFQVVRNSYSNNREMLMNGECLWIMRNVGETFKDTLYGKILKESIEEEDKLE